MPNLASIQADLYSSLMLPTSPATEVVARLLRYVNETQHEILARKTLSRLRRAVLPFSTVASSPFAVLPQAVVAIQAITDRTNQWDLDQVSIEELRMIDPGLSQTTSFPVRYAILNLSAPVAADPSDASELFFKSDSAADGATKTMFIEGVTSNGQYRTSSAAMNGVTAVSFGPTITTWTHITKIFLALTAGGLATAAGNVTILEDSGVGSELGRITIGRSFARYTQLHMHPTPSTAATLYADVELRIEEMVQATDESYVPEDFSYLLGVGARMREFTRRQDPISYSQERARWKDGMANLQTWANRQPHPSRGRSMRRYSQLGPYYPVGS